MDPKLEIRRLLPSHLKELSSRLEINEYWKDLMKIIPLTLDAKDFKCDISAHNHHKYNIEHLRLIENHSEKSKRTCTEILFDEWGTSGRVRPTLGHLLHLLVKAKLFKAADYVAMNMLHQPRPQRPKSGPEADITVDLGEILRREEEIEKLLDEIDYPLGGPQQAPNLVPAIVVTPDADEDPEGRMELETRRHEAKSVSDMMKFSSDVTRTSTSTCTTATSRSYDSSETTQIGPAFSALLGSDRTNVPSSTDDAGCLPAFSEIAEYSQNVPDLSLLNLEVDTRSDAESPAGIDTEEESGVLPDFGALKPDFPETSCTTATITSCPSPLPPLTLDTELPHVAYSTLEAATDSFNDAPHTAGGACAGRFLGAGEFGSVYLAPDLMGGRAAVKRLSLGGRRAVDVGDRVTRQFCNEVELLSRYVHRNLVRLLGFSCDGSTYCLVYEFVAGGALRDRLQVDEGILSWKQRLNIAVGTSKAIAYLHTAFSSPLIHRDVKSANILLDENNNPKLCDFGLIKLIPNQDVKVTTSVFGTSAYMPREAFAGDISVKLDTFSFGVVLLELITSLPPVDDDREGSDLVTHVNETIEDDNILPLVDFKAGAWFEKEVNYAQGLYAITLKCLAEKKNRPTMVEVKMELDELTKCVQIF